MKVIAGGVEFHENQGGRLINLMARGHKIRTGHDLDAEYVESEKDPGIFVLVRHCCEAK